MRVDIYIRTMTGKSLTVCVDSEETVEELKRKLYGEQWEQYRLLFAGRHLEDGLTLASYNIQHECTIHEVTILRGGGPPPDEDNGVRRTDSMDKLANMQEEESSGWCCIM